MLRMQIPRLCAVFFMALAFSRMSIYAVAQDAKGEVQEPQYIGDFAQVKADGSIIPLEKEKMTQEVKSHNHFISVSVAGNYVCAQRRLAGPGTTQRRFRSEDKPGIGGDRSK